MPIPKFAALVVAVALGWSGTVAYAVGRIQITGVAEDSTGADVSISATADANGANPSGGVNLSLSDPRDPKGDPLQLRLKVTCLVVSGNIGSLGAVNTEASSGAFPAGYPFVLTVKDSGTPDGTGDGLTVIPGATAATCAGYLGAAEASDPIRQGDLHVRS